MLVKVGTKVDSGIKSVCLLKSCFFLILIYFVLHMYYIFMGSFESRKYYIFMGSFESRKY